MENKGNHRDSRGWPEPGPHEKFLELCAISTSGELTEEERKDLQAHLAECSECRQSLKEFEAAADIGMPLLHSQLAGPDSFDPDSVPTEAAKSLPFPAMKNAETATGQSESAEQGSPIEFSQRNGHGRRPLNWNYVWMPFAAAVVLSAALGIYSYQVGKQRGRENQAIVQVPPVTPDSKSNTKSDTKVNALEQEISDAGR